MPTSDDTVGDLLRHRARLLGWVFVACVIPGAFLLAGGATPRIVLAVVFAGTALMPWALGPFAVKLKKNAVKDKDDLMPRQLFNADAEPCCRESGDIVVRNLTTGPSFMVVKRNVVAVLRYRRFRMWSVATVVAAILFILSAICWVALHF